MKARFFFAAALFVGLPGPLNAEDEDAERGRLPDGRAFRTDVAGNQMVDYIAELEVTIEGLNRRVYGLEDELAQKNRQLEQAGVNLELPPGQALGERDLTRTSDRRVPAPQLPLGESTPKDCGPQLAALKEAVDAKQRQLDLLGNKHTEQLRAQVRDVSETEARLEGSEKQVQALTEQLEQSESRIRSLMASNQRLEREASEALATSRAMASNRTIEARAAEPGTADSLGSARRRALESYKGSLSTEINKVRSIIVTRDKLYQSYLASPRAVKLKPSPAVSSRKKSLDQVRKDLESAQTMQTMAMLSKDVREIKSKMADDIDTLKRMGRYQ